MPQVERHHLLGSSSSSGPSSPPPSSQPIPHLPRKIRLHLCRDRTSYPHGQVPGDIAGHTQFLQTPPHPYLPIVDVDKLSSATSSELNLLSHFLRTVEDPSIPKRDAFVPLSTLPHDPTSPANLTHFGIILEIHSVSLGWFRLTRSIGANIDLLSSPSSSSAMKISQEEGKNMKGMIADTDPSLLALTLLAALLHGLFEWLAFKEDVQHWRKLESLEGTSYTAVLLDAATRCITVLYLYEKRQETSMLILGGAILSAGTSLWKVRRALSHRAASSRAQAKEGKDGKDAQKRLTLTQKADAQATRYFLILAPPVVLAYAIWSLYYMRHTGYHAWMMHSLMALMYLTGFITMTPQLLVNHALKSVDAMPVKVFIYRFLNTVVDDLFALVMPMPGLTRAAAFRDDIIFVLLIGQMWWYRRRRGQEEIKVEQEEREKVE
ncbi:MAG: cleft lip and palate transmembrane protein 1-domain-containing protein [Piptocephalis tieghemiana]|nr:MAG: cleft lip and palate transmembrane protein 1-domain-containing protein [Piptocephalis tieghemiana]